MGGIHNAEGRMRKGWRVRESHLRFAWALALPVTITVCGGDPEELETTQGTELPNMRSEALPDYKQGEDWTPAVGETEIMVLEDGWAIGGYDPVAYFTEGRATPGREEWSYSWSGATWIFSSVEHRDLFEEHPERYAPQFGGWCAYGVSGHKHVPGYGAESRPQDSWSVIGGKLYFNWSPAVAETFRSEFDDLIIDAERYWPDVREDVLQGGVVHRQTGIP